MRTGKAKQIDLTLRSNDYCDSLDELPGLVAASRQPNAHAPALVGYVSPANDGKDRPQLVICHDYKGGYTEGGAELRRDYTFNWWQLTDTFVYFSHHRVTVPPPAWVRSAHSHGTKILGTLIFEWDQGQNDLVNLVGHDGAIRLDYADGLVELAAARGFEGWLVNVEVPASPAQAESLMVWLAYLRDRVKDNLVGGEVMWYDGLNAHGKVKWQNRLTHLNQPFLDHADSIFLNYFWQPDWLKDTQTKMDGLLRPRSEALVGLDVWGRGQFGGGGFDSWIAMDAIESHPPTNARPGAPPSGVGGSEALGLSAAVFAPAWTVESEHLGHELSTADGYRKWLADELYLWIGGTPTANVEKERVRRDKQRRHDRALRHVLGLANKLAAPPSVLRSLDPPRLDLYAPLPPLPGHFRPLADYRPRPRAPPTRASHAFRTNFALGSGHAFWVEGVRAHASAEGWTDVGLVQSGPGLAYHGQVEGVKVGVVDGDSWFGAQACRVEATRASRAKYPGGVAVALCPIYLRLVRNRPLRVRIMWKPVRGATRVPAEAEVAAHLDATEGASGAFVVRGDETKAVEGTGWYRTVAEVVATREEEGEVRLMSFGVRLMAHGAADKGVDVLVGELSLTPVGSDRARVAGLAVDPSGAWARWRVEPAAGPPAEFESFTVWLLPPGAGPTTSVGAELLGVTAATEFVLPEAGHVPGARVAVRVVWRDGEVQAWEDAALADLP